MTAFIEGARALFSSALTPHSFHLTTAHPFFSSRDQNVNRRALVTLFPSVIFYNSRNADRIDTVFRKIQNLMFRLGGDPRRRPEARKRVVVLGTGWGAMNFINRIDVTKYDVIIISPRNYFAFTPLLPSVSSGTVSARSTLEPVRNKLMRGGKKVMDFHEAWAVHVSDSQVSHVPIWDRPKFSQSNSVACRCYCCFIFLIRKVLLAKLQLGHGLKYHMIIWLLVLVLKSIRLEYPVFSRMHIS